MRRYRNRPMSLADACLVRLSEIHAAAAVLTLDSDFRIYRATATR
jgi:predicted nucleic acid-binding protein